jgi:hypothetical protein
MTYRKTVIAAALMLSASPAWSQADGPAPARTRPAPQTNWWSQAAGENGPTRFVWAAQKDPETRYNAINKPIWHIADVLKAHQKQSRWEQQVLLNRDFDGRYVQMAAGDKSKCKFWADDRAWGWVYSGQLKVTIDGQEPKVLPKGWVFNVAPRLSYCLETVGSEPAVFYITTPAGQAPSYPENETPAPMKGYRYVKAKINSTGGYDSFNMPFFNVDEYGASTRTGERFLYDGHTSSNLNIGPPLTQLPPDTSWGHFHENMQEVWLNVYGNVCALISGVGVVHGEYGDLINANEERWHRATSCPNSGRSIRMAITPRSKEGQVHYFQIDQPPGN